ncbi:unnamed protein product [Ambrosiozyma monospora]|uniref:Unnamed protein product n=1 Tax=Ambrosiozyma monospora TaxID=43982 RepID=A0ACB5T813_AMBMO|nr:unnamed protein product [Ambrosiozyma monospora]
MSQPNRTPAQTTTHSLNFSIVDETIISEKICSRKTPKDWQQGEIFEYKLTAPRVQYVYKDEEIDPSTITNDNDTGNGLGVEQGTPPTIISVKLKDDAESIDAVTTLSDTWQASRYTTQKWKFIDEGSQSQSQVKSQQDGSVDRGSGIGPGSVPVSNSKVQEYTAFTLYGNASELIVKNETVNDLVPKSDLKYATKLVDLFVMRNKQLSDVMALNDS